MTKQKKSTRQAIQKRLASIAIFAMLATFLAYEEPTIDIAWVTAILLLTVYLFAFEIVDVDVAAIFILVLLGLTDFLAPVMGLVLVAAGIVYFVLAGHLVLPSIKRESTTRGRDTITYFHDLYGIHPSLSEVVVRDGNELVGIVLGEVEVTYKVRAIGIKYSGEESMVGPGSMDYATKFEAGMVLRILAATDRLDEFVDRFKLRRRAKLGATPSRGYKNYLLILRLSTGTRAPILNADIAKKKPRCSAGLFFRSGSSYFGTTFAALGPLGPRSLSKVTVCPSASDLNPPLWMAE